MLRKLIKLNLDDLWLYAGGVGGAFLLFEIVVCGVMYFVKPEDSLTVSCIILPTIAGFLSLIVGITHVGVTFEQALCFGQTRRRALGLTLGVMAFESAFGMALAFALSMLERFVCPALWVRLAGADGWMAGTSMGYWENALLPDGTGPVSGFFYENMAGEMALLPDNTLLVNTFALDWYWWPLIFAAGLCGGVIIGALIQRFGSKGGWIIWGVVMGFMILGQLLPWKTHEITNWLWPLAGVIFVCGFLWSLWSMLHAVVRG